MMKKEQAFGTKLYSMFIGSILIPALIAILCFGGYSNKTINEREERNIQNILNSVSQNLEMQISAVKNIEQAFYIYKEVFQEAEMLNNPGLYENYDELTKLDIENGYTMTLTKLLQTSGQDIRAVVFFPVSGEDTAYYLGKDNARLREINYPGYKGENWYQEAVENEDEADFKRMHTPDYMPNKKLGSVYSYIKSVRDMNSGRVIGVVKIDVSGRQIEETFSVLEQNGDSGLMLLKNGEYFAASEWIEEKGGIQIIDRDRVKAGNTVYYMRSEAIDETTLSLAYLDSRTTLYKGFLSIIVLSMLIMMAGVILAFINYRHQASKMVQDVERITDVLQQVEKGNFDARIAIRKESEFKKIADAVNEMADHLKTYVEKEYIMEIQQQRAEYRALQSQINPHFLYNTLNGFVALNRMGEKKVLERSIIELSRLFRYTCTNKEEVTIQEEIRFLEDYLNLEKLKYEERLEYMIWTDEESRGRRIPKMLLQPVVENSIKHGMGDGSLSVMIRIMAETTEVKGAGKATVLTVRDNGAGFDSSAPVKEGEHVGVDNVKARVELFCRNAIFQCSSKPGEGTKTTIVFPYEKEGEEK